MAHVLPVHRRPDDAASRPVPPATAPRSSAVVPATIALGVGVILLSLLVGRVLPEIRVLGLNLVVGVLDCCIAAFAGLMAQGRFARDRRLQDAALSIGLRIVAVSGLIEILLRLFHVTVPLLPAGLRVAGTVAIVVAGVAPSAYRLHRARPASVLLAAPLIVALVGTPLLVLTPTLALDPDGDGSALERLIPGLDYLQPIDALIGSALVVAAVGFWLRGTRDRDPFVRVLGVAFGIAAAARFHYVLYPALSAGVFSGGDVLRTTAYAVILAAAFREWRGYWTARAEVSMLEDRRRIARELHDGVVQELAFMRLEAKALGGPAAERIAAAADRALDESRGAVRMLASGVDARLDVALREALVEMAERHGFALAVDAGPLAATSADERHAVLRIAREAVGNAIRSGDAASVEVHLHAGRTGRELRIEDDGCGFDTAAVGRGFGLRSMHERSAALGGTCRVDSAPGRGTVVTVTW